MNISFIQMINSSVTLTHNNFEVDLVQRAMDNMDPEVKTHLERTYTGHLGGRARDRITQIRALQALQSHAEQSESQVIGMRKIVSNLASTALLSAPGYAAAVGDGVGAAEFTPALKSQPEATIQQHTPVKGSAWKKGNHFRCNSQNCQWLRDGGVVCPHRDHPGVRERAQIDYKKFKDYKKKMREKRKQEQGWDGLDKKIRVLLTKSIADSADNQRNFKAHMNARRDEAGDSEGVANAKAPDSTCMGLFSLLQCKSNRPQVASCRSRC